MLERERKRERELTQGQKFRQECGIVFHRDTHENEKPAAFKKVCSRFGQSYENEKLVLKSLF